MTDFSLHPGEKVLVTLRKHWLVLVGAMIPYVILDYLPYLLPSLATFLDSISTSNIITWSEILSFDNPWVRFVVGVYWLFVWMAALGTLSNHFLDKWIVTNQRIVDIEQETFWNRQVSSVLLSRVQDVQIEVYGFFNTLFHFGTVIVESAGADVESIKMPYLPNPEQVRDLILKEARRELVEENNPPGD